MTKLQKIKTSSRANDENFDVPGSSQEENNGVFLGETGSEAEVAPFIYYGARTAPPPVAQEPRDRYLVGGTKRITVDCERHPFGSLLFPPGQLTTNDLGSVSNETNGSQGNWFEGDLTRKTFP